MGAWWSLVQFYPRRGAQPPPRTRLSLSLIASCLTMVIQLYFSLIMSNQLLVMFLSEFLNKNISGQKRKRRKSQTGRSVFEAPAINGIWIMYMNKETKRVNLWYTQWVYCTVLSEYYCDMITHTINTICLAYVHVCIFCHGLHCLLHVYMHSRQRHT